MCAESGVPPRFEHVGKITVTDHAPTAAARDIAREAVRNLSADKVKGRTVRVQALENGATGPKAANRD